MELRRPTIADKDTILDMLAEFEAAGSAMDGGHYPKDLVYEEWLEQNLSNEMGLDLPNGYVPAIQYVSFDQTGKALGFLNLRLRLNDFLLKKGGHIGYSIRPTERGKGYAKDQLRLGLREATTKNISKVLVTCSTENQASRRTIVACGGVLEDIRDGIERYWIE
ncbi:GNAT family N-acetyltransferase [Streptococcus suis]